MTRCVGTKSYVKWDHGRLCQWTHSPMLRDVRLLFGECLLGIHQPGIIVMRYCFMGIYLHSDSISPWCVRIFRSAHFYWDISSSSGALPRHPLNHLSLGLSLEEFQRLYAFGCHRELRTVTSCAMMCILQGELRSDVVNKPSGSFWRQGIESADLTDWACSLLHCCWQPLTLPPASLMDWDQQPIKPLWLPNSLVPIGDILFLYFPSHLFLVWWALLNNC